jgi:hypothetical protein
MKKLPRLVAFIGWLFIIVGVVGFGYHINEFNRENPFDPGVLWVLLLRLLAILGGVLLLRGIGWARWVLLLWLGYHVILGAMHSVTELLLHAVIFAGVAYVLRRETSAYFQRAR